MIQSDGAVAWNRLRRVFSSTFAVRVERVTDEDARRTMSDETSSVDGSSVSGGEERTREEASARARRDAVAGRAASEGASASEEGDRSRGRASSSVSGSDREDEEGARARLANVAYPMFLCDERHHVAFGAEEEDNDCDAEELGQWRTKDRMKTVSVALVLCLNIGVDPPDTMKISPCARMQCWIQPMTTQPQNELDAIGKALQAQYERWQPRAKYKLQLDPTTEDMKKLCISSRRNAKNERVLLHYNGHGVPRPTTNGEIWVFNKSYTQYIPLSVYDLHSWTGTPAIYVFDCSNAGLIVKSFLKLSDPSSSVPPPKAAGDFEERQVGGSAAFAQLERGKQANVEDSGFGPSDAASSANECILIAACGANELLPQSAELPADVFSACLTTPVKMALHWFCLNSVLRGRGITVDIIDKIPGMQNNRKTPLGELNWIFTAITDTIAWNVLPRKLFQRLFRQDLLVASLFRNFLLAERIMRANNCTPISSPRLPPTHQHPMWAAWDMAVEQCLLQMPTLLSGDPEAEFVPSPFFTDQLTAFEVWLEYGNQNDAPPEQLPIVLQVLLSQSHRLRALILLGRFLDLGLWAVELALSVGIFPYVLKLLQTTAPELRQILVFIWTKILALDRSCQADLVKDDGHTYFIRFLQNANVPVEERAMAAFILAVISDGHEKGQSVCLASGLMDICLSNIQEAAQPDVGSPFFLRWLCLCLGKLWEDNLEAQRAACNVQAHKQLISLLTHSSPEARAAAVCALGSLVSWGVLRDSATEEELQRQGSAGMGSNDGELMHAMSSQSIFGPTLSSTPQQSFGESDGRASTPLEDILVSPGAIARMEIELANHLLTTAQDASPIVRMETAVALARLAAAHKVMIREALIAWKRDYDSVTAIRVVKSKRSEAMGVQRRFSHGHGSFNGLDNSVGSNMFTVDEDNSLPTNVEGVARSADEQFMANFERTSGALPPAYPQLHEESDTRSAEGPKGSIYTLILQALLDLATDAAPSVATVSMRALRSICIEKNHPIMQMATKSGNFADEPKVEEAHRRRPSFASLDFGISHDRSSSKDLGGSPKARTLERSDSWHQRLANIGSRLLGSPTKPKPVSTLSGNREPQLSPSKASGGRLEGRPRMSTSRDKGRKLQTLESPVSSTGHLPALAIPRSRAEEVRNSPTQPSALRRTTSTFITDHHGSDHDMLGTVHRFGSHASLESLDSPGGPSTPLLPDEIMENEPPKSVIYKRSCGHFCTPLLESAQEEEDVNDDESENGAAPWLRPPDMKRRAELLQKMQDAGEQTMVAGERRHKMTEYISSIDVGGGVIPTSIIMHPFESEACAGDSKGRVHVWERSSSRMKNKIETGMKSVNVLALINETDDALLLTGCTDGTVKIWRDYSAIKEEKLVTAWNALPWQQPAPITEEKTTNMHLSFYKPSTHHRTQESTEAVIIWQQLTGCLYATGNAPNPLLRVWDVSSEICRETLSLQSPGTCLTAEGALLMAGTHDGEVLSYDLRAPARLLSAMQTHTQPVVSILLQPGGVNNLLVTGCSDGQMKFCDLRNASTPFLTAEVAKPMAQNRDPALTALDGHSYSSVIASGSSERAIKLWDLRGNNFATIQYTNSFLGNRIGAVSALAFHPNLPYLAAGSNAGHATIYGS